MAVTGYKKVGTDKYGNTVESYSWRPGTTQQGGASGQSRYAQGGYGQGYGNNGQAAMQGVSENTKKQLEKYQQGYKPADSVTAAQQTLQQVQNQKPQGYNSKYSAPLENILQQIQNPEKFDYEFNGDNLFKAYADMYTQKGKQASLDVQGQAAAMTGGYGNSYAETAGAQAYQQYMTELYDKGLSMRDRAYQAYQDELDNKREQYNILQQAENAEYGRYRDTYSDWQREEEQAYNRAQAEREMDYKEYMDALNYYTGLMQIENQAWASEAERQEAIRQYEQSFAEQQRQYDTTLGEQQRQYDTSMAEQQRQYDTSFAEQQRQYDTSFGEQVRQYDTTLEEQKRQYDASLEAQYYGYENQKQIAEIGAAASRYGADRSLEGSLASAQASMYAAQLSAKSAADRLALEREQAAKQGKDKEKETARQQAYTLMDAGKMPDSATLKAAGISETEAKAYLESVQKKLESAEEEKQYKRTQEEEEKQYKRTQAEEEKGYQRQQDEETLTAQKKAAARTQAFKLLDGGTMPEPTLLTEAGMTQAEAESYLAGVQAKLKTEQEDKQYAREQTEGAQAKAAAQAQCQDMVGQGHMPSKELLQLAGYTEEWAEAMVKGKKDTYVPVQKPAEKPWYQGFLEGLGGFFGI